MDFADCSTLVRDLSDGVENPYWYAWKQLQADVSMNFQIQSQAHGVRQSLV